MSNKQRLLFGISALVLITAGCTYWYLSAKMSKMPTSPISQNSIGIRPGTTPVETPEPIPSGPTRPIKTNDNGSLNVTEFLSDADVAKDLYNTQYYYLGYREAIGMADSTGTENPPYTITYNSSTDYFNITLLTEPVGKTRAVAEQYLQSKLHIPNDQMCRLKYAVSVPNRVNTVYSSINLGFSYCRGATMLPQ
jgi:hypothetical protein